MSHYFSSDEDLTALATQLEYVPFELTEADHMHFQELYQDKLLKNVSMYIGGRTFRVRLCIGGKQHVLGITRKGPNAARFADMARLFFWRYRLRDKRLPEDSEFNYGLEATEHAMEHNDEAVHLLEKLRDHLIRVAKLAVTSSTSESERSERKTLQETRRTVRGELLHIHQESLERAKLLEGIIQTFEKAMETSIKDNAHSFDQIKQAFQQISERLTAVEADLKQANPITAPAVSL